MRKMLFILAAVLVFAPAAVAARVSVRVEGKTTTIFGGLQTPFESGTSALTALDAASARGEFYYHVTQFSFGPFVDQIGRYQGDASAGWLYKVNGVSPPVGANDYRLRDGDRVLFYWARFNPEAPTLMLTRAGRNCYRVVSEDRVGADTPAAGAVLRVDGRRVRTRAGRACVGRHAGLVRATLTGAVRSNALR